MAAAPAAAAGNGGVAPVAPASPNAEAIRHTYWLVLGVTGAIFLLVEAALVVFLFRFRRRGRPAGAEGPQVRGNLRLELAWTAVPVLILAAIAGFVFAKLPDIESAPSAQAAGGPLEVTVEGRQFYWLFRYPGGEVSVDRLVVPVGRVVSLKVVSPDVVHSWWIPALGGKIDAIPGRTNRTWFRADRPGTYRGQCAELCGVEHALMRARVEVVPPRAYRAFLAAHRPGSPAVGRESFQGVCAKCHGPAGEGRGSAPPLQGRTFDQATAAVIEEGIRAMPAVGAGWSPAQVQATIAYLKRRFAPAGVQGGG
jgi:cytochrome c oxidase subunit 2